MATSKIVHIRISNSLPFPFIRIIYSCQSFYIDCFSCSWVNANNRLDLFVFFKLWPFLSSPYRLIVPVFSILLFPWTHHNINCAGGHPRHRLGCNIKELFRGFFFHMPWLLVILIDPNLPQNLVGWVVVLCPFPCILACSLFVQVARMKHWFVAVDIEVMHHLTKRRDRRRMIRGMWVAGARWVIEDMVDVDVGNRQWWTHYIRREDEEGDDCRGECLLKQHRCNSFGKWTETMTYEWIILNLYYLQVRMKQVNVNCVLFVLTIQASPL